MLNMVSGWRREFEPVGTFGSPQAIAWRYFDLIGQPALWVRHARATTPKPLTPLALAYIYRRRTSNFTFTSAEIARRNTKILSGAYI
jgi:hypothetical protein